MGRYRGDLGAHIEDFNILICDPNHPGLSRTLIADVARRVYHYQEGDPQTWRTYFVDKNYHAQQPPAIGNANFPMDNLVYELVLKFFTGGDDLRGGNDNDLIVNLTDGSSHLYSNINLGSRWVVNNDESAEVRLQTPIRVEQLQSIVISDTFSGGAAGDNWNMASLEIYVLGGGPFYGEIKKVGSKRFTGDDKTLIVPLQ
jgi:hypothetical protein